MSVRAIAAALLLTPALSNANLLLGSTVNCSGNLSVYSGFAQPSSISCSGNLSFFGGSLSSDAAFSITAAEDLSFYSAFVSAPSLNLQAGGVLTLDADSVLSSEDITLSAGSLAIYGQIAPVPEPSSLLLMLSGLAVIGVAYSAWCDRIGKMLVKMTRRPKPTNRRLSKALASSTVKAGA